MNDREFELTLAEYLAGEMSPVETGAFEAILAGDRARRQMVDELRDAAGAVRTAVPAAELAEQRTRGLSLAAERSRATGAPRWRLLAALARYAAVILLAFSLGFMARGWRSDGRATPPTVVENRAAPYEVQFAKRYAQASQANPGASSFERTLLAIARR
jgi:anti-sigma factor RsiW